jgi:hypothetical protein
MLVKEILGNVTARTQQTIREALGADFDRRPLTEAEQAFIDAMDARTLATIFDIKRLRRQPKT